MLIPCPVFFGNGFSAVVFFDDPINAIRDFNNFQAGELAAAAVAQFLDDLHKRCVVARDAGRINRFCRLCRVVSDAVRK